MLICIILSLALVNIGKATDSEVSLEKISSCSCWLPNSTVVDLSSLALSDQPRWLDAPPADTTPWRYSYNPCYPFTLEAVNEQGTHCKNVAICQRSISLGSKPEYNNVGLQETATFTLRSSTSVKALLSKVQFKEDINPPMIAKVMAGVEEHVVISYMDKVDGTPERNGIVILTCTETAAFQAVGQVPKTEPMQYVLMLADPAVCPVKRSRGGLSIGSALCIIFFVGIVLYIIIGVLFMKYIRKANGADLVPNRQFWIILPSYVKEGARFTVGKVTRKGDNYQQI